jgi:uncharacterized metal-binding protein YceD (DUF177 family)
VRIDTLGAAPREIEIEADAAERGALAGRFDLQAIEELKAQAAVSRHGQIVRANGNLSAKVMQSCIATGAPVEAEVREPFHIEFRPEPSAGDPDEEVELSEGELDVIFYTSAAIDLGDAVAESLLLALDPYPRCPDADASLAQAGVIKEGEEPRTGALAGLKDLLSKGH